MVGHPSASVLRWAREMACSGPSFPPPSAMPPHSARIERNVLSRMQIKLLNARSVPVDPRHLYSIHNAPLPCTSSMPITSPLEAMMPEALARSPRGLLTNRWETCFASRAHDFGRTGTHDPPGAVVACARSELAAGADEWDTAVAHKAALSGAVSARAALQRPGHELPGAGGDSGDTRSPRTAALRALQVADAVDAYERHARWTLT